MPHRTESAGADKQPVVISVTLDNVHNRHDKRRCAHAAKQENNPGDKDDNNADSVAAAQHIILHEIVKVNAQLHYLEHPYVKPTTKKFITFFEVFRAAS